MKLSLAAKFDIIVGVIRILVIWLILFLFGSKAHAQTTGWVEEREFVKSGQVIHRVDGLVNGTINGKVGTFVWFQVDKSYAEAYGGITFSPRPWVQLAVGPGLEQAGNLGRVGGYIWLGKGKTNVLFVPEYGGSGWWSKTEFNQRVGREAGVGFMYERFRGVGPRLEFNFKKLMLWTAPLVEEGRVNGLVGVRWKF